MKPNAFKRVYFKTRSLPWAKTNLKRILPHLKKSDNILDIGAGKCAMSYLLKSKGYKITSTDIKNKSYTKDIKPIVFDGKTLTFKNNSFDTALLITVLHHTPNPEATLNEAKRVAKKIIIIEDTYTNPVQKYATYIMDSIMNLECIGHPHTNKNDREWKSTFKKLKLKLIHSDTKKVLAFFRQTLYVVKK